MRDSKNTRPVSVACLHCPPRKHTPHRHPSALMLLSSPAHVFRGVLDQITGIQPAAQHQTWALCTECPRKSAISFYAYITYVPRYATELATAALLPSISQIVHCLTLHVQNCSRNTESATITAALISSSISANICTAWKAVILTSNKQQNVLCPCRYTAFLHV